MSDEAFKPTHLPRIPEGTITMSLSEMQAQRDRAIQALNDHIVKSAFERSTYVREHLSIPSAIAEATFGKSGWRVSDGRLIGVNDRGEDILSETSPGSYASFDDVLAQRVAQTPYAGSITKGSQGYTGPGAPVAKQTILRSQFDKLDQQGQRAAVMSGVEVVHDY